VATAAAIAADSTVSASRPAVSATVRPPASRDTSAATKIVSGSIAIAMSIAVLAPMAAPPQAQSLPPRPRAMRRPAPARPGTAVSATVSTRPTGTAVWRWRNPQAVPSSAMLATVSPTAAPVSVP
jgi:hypothetical protein